MFNLQHKGESELQAWIRRRKKHLKAISNNLKTEQLELEKYGINIETEVIGIRIILDLITQRVEKG